MNDNAETLRRAWEIYDHAEAVLGRRMNYGMVAQSMLLVSFCTLFAYQSQIPGGYAIAAEVVVGTLGLGYSLFQYSRIKSVSNRIRFLQTSYLIKLDPVFAAYMGSYSHSWFQPLIRQHMVALAFCGGWTLLIVLGIGAARAH